MGAAVALRTGWGILPGGVRWSHLMAGATLAGIGFTISLFIADLAFSDAQLREQATIGVLAGSLTAAVSRRLSCSASSGSASRCARRAPRGPPTLPPRPWVDPAVGARADADHSVP